MKKLVVVSIALILVLHTYAQKKFSGGLFVTPGISWLKPVNTKEAKNTGVGLSYKIGAEMNINMVDNFAFCMALQYASYGGKFSMDSVTKIKTTEEEIINVQNVEVKSKLGYLELPLSFKGKTKVDHMTYFIKAGGHVGFRVSPPKANLIVTKGATPKEYTDVLIPDEISFLNLGYHIGGGIEYDLTGDTRIYVECLYNGGFWPVSTMERIKPSGSATIKPNLSLSDVGLKIGILF